MFILPELICRFNSSETQKDFFIGFDKLILEFIWKIKGPKSKTLLKKNHKTQELTLPDVNTSKTVIIKTIWYLYRDRQIDYEIAQKKRSVHTWKVDFRLR